MTKLRVMKQDSGEEINFLIDVKKQFGWPVDRLRYGITGESARFIDENGVESNMLPLSVQERMGWSLKKLAQIEKYVAFFKSVPWIEAVWVTGSVASLDADEHDDIDIWLITQERRLWLVRTLEFLYFGVLGMRRLAGHRNDSIEVSNKLCFNMYTTVSQLELPSHSRSFAIQFADAVPIYFRNSALFKGMIEQNSWIAKFLPSWYSRQNELLTSVSFSNVSTRIPVIDNVLDVVEYIAGVLMLLKARKKLYFKFSDIFTNLFTTWGTPRILSTYEETESKGRKTSE